MFVGVIGEDCPSLELVVTRSGTNVQGFLDIVCSAAPLLHTADRVMSLCANRVWFSVVFVASTVLIAAGFKASLWLLNLPIPVNCRTIKYDIQSP